MTTIKAVVKRKGGVIVTQDLKPGIHRGKELSNGQSRRQAEGNDHLAAQPRADAKRQAKNATPDVKNGAATNERKNAGRKAQKKGTSVERIRLPRNRMRPPAEVALKR